MRREFRKRTALGVMVATLASAPAEALVAQLTSSHTRKLATKNTAGARRGRPRKFSRPSRAVTLTLPEDVIDALRAIDADLSRAVVGALVRGAAGSPRSPAEVASYGGDRSLIVVPHSRTLEARTGVELVPLPDGRALLSFDDYLSVPEFELRLIDALADPSLDEADRVVFGAIAGILRNTRQEEKVAVEHRSIIVLRG